MGARRGNKFGWHSGVLTAKDGKFLGDVYVQDDIVFSDVSAGTLGVTGGIDMQSTTSAIGIDMGGTFATAAINIDGTCSTAGIRIAGGSTYNPIHIGTKSNTAGDGIDMTGAVQDNMNGVMIFADDGGADLTNSWSTSPIWTRFVITANQTSNTATGAYLQQKLYGNRTLTSCDYSAIKAYLECSGTVGLTTADLGVINCGLEIGGNVTVTSGTFSGIDVNINASTYSITAGSAGVLVRKTSGSTTTWPIGLSIQDSGAVIGIQIGDCTTGILLDGDFTTGIDINAEAALDDGITINAEAGVTIARGITLTTETTGIITTGISLVYTSNATACIAATVTSGDTITSGISLSGAGTYTTGIKLDSTAAMTDGILISATTPVDGIQISSACSGHMINLSGSSTGNGITISGATSDTGIEISGTCTNFAIDISAAQTAVGLAISSTCGTYGVAVTGACTTAAIGITGAEAIGILISNSTPTSGISISAACADGIAISGANTTAALHISGDQAIGILYDANENATDGIKFSVDDGKTITTGINLARTGTTGVCTTGISIDTDGTTAISIGAGFTGTDGIVIAGTASADGIRISGACGTAIDTGDASTTGIDIGSCTTGISFTGTITDGISFAGATPTFGQDNAFIDIGTYTTAMTIASMTDVFIPIQVHLDNTGDPSSDKDLAACRFRIDNITNTQTHVNSHVIQTRQQISVNVASFANIQQSTQLAADVTIASHSYGIIGKVEGTGNLTGEYSVIGALMYHTGTNSGGAWCFDADIVDGATASALYRAHVQSGGTATSALFVYNNGGTMTNVINITGGMTNFLNLANATTGGCEADTTANNWTHRLKVNIAGVGTRYIKLSDA